MHCPRCDYDLREVEPSAMWQRHFICDDCFSAWHIVDGRLVQGKKQGQYAAGLELLGPEWSTSLD